VRLLLDTHVLLWALQDHPRIRKIRKRLLDPDHEVFFSVASLWEIAIKQAIGKIDADPAAIRDVAREDGFVELPILGTHVLAIMELPPLHRDPFDRLLVAQAASEPMHLLTGDALLAGYGELVELI
jgi:PIN domain nuclease of toxin-antitoxin system